ncbi:MAG: OmpA family protein, partial [Pseudomonadota bacterium]
DGQTIRLTGEAPDRAARDQAVADLRRATGASGPVLGGIARVDASAATLMPQPLLQDPFRFRADYQGGFVKFDLHIPHEGFGNRLGQLGAKAFPNARRTFDETVLARGMPDEGWPLAIITALTTLGKLDSGYLYAEEKLIKLNGISTVLTESDVRAALGPLPSGYRVRADLTLSALPVKLDITGTNTAAPLDWSQAQWQPAGDKAEPSAPLPQPTGPGDPSQNLLPGDETIPLITRPAGTNAPPDEPTQTRMPTLPRSVPTNGNAPDQLNVPSPAQLRTGQTARPLAQPTDKLPNRPEPVEAFKTEPMMVETAPLQINPPKSEFGPEVGREPKAEANRQPVAPVRPPSVPAPASRATTRDQKMRGSRMPTTYVPPRADESAAEKSARLCQNEVAMMMKFQGIAFFPASRDLTPETRALLAALTDTLSRCTDHRIDIIGHTDNIGSAMENLQLSRERARIVADVFAMNGIARRAMTSTGLGERLPIADNASERGRMLNRRVEILISPRPARPVADKKGR